MDENIDGERFVTGAMVRRAENLFPKRALFTMVDQT